MSNLELVKHIVIVGDGAVGKTCLLLSYANRGEFDESKYIPTIYENTVVQLDYGGETHLLKFHDTAGQEDYERLRRVIYKEADCFLLCFSIDNRVSFENILTKWHHELEPYKVPIVLVATKSDITRFLNPISMEEILKFKRKLNASSFIECSAKNYDNINEVVYAAIEAIKGGVPQADEQTAESWWDRMLNCCFHKD